MFYTSFLPKRKDNLKMFVMEFAHVLHFNVSVMCLRKLSTAGFPKEWVATPCAMGREFGSPTPLFWTFPNRSNYKSIGRCLEASAGLHQASYPLYWPLQTSKRPAEAASSPTPGFQLLAQLDLGDTSWEGLAACFRGQGGLWHWEV